MTESSIFQNGSLWLCEFAEPAMWGYCEATEGNRAMQQQKVSWTGGGGRGKQQKRVETRCYGTWPHANLTPPEMWREIPRAVHWEKKEGAHK